LTEGKSDRGWLDGDRAADNRNFTGTSMQTADPTRFILLHTSHPGNVGAAARAMKVMGFSDLVLVAPKCDDVLSDAQAIAMASSAVDIVQSARIVSRLVDALDAVDFVCATAMTPRGFGPDTHAPRELFATLASSDRRVAFVFGGERFGISNDDVYRCHAVLSIPTHQDYGSLNLAQAVQLVAYDWRQALGGFDVARRTGNTTLADAAAVQGLLAHWERALAEIGFLDRESPKKLLPRLNQLFNRARLTPEEIDILRGIAKAMLSKPR
jgi:tRNA/rRNA methyltransferase